MIDRDFLRQHSDIVAAAVASRNVSADVSATLDADQAYREQLQTVEALRRELKTAKGEVSEAERARLRETKSALKEAETVLDELQRKTEQLLRDLPNIPRPDVPVGKNEDDNVVVRTVGEPPVFSFPPKSYLELATKHDLIDLERAAKVSGARFTYLKNELALLSQALVRYAMDIALSHGFTPVLPPVLINERAMAGMGYLEHGGADETYHFEKDDLYLVGTSEQSIGPMHMDEILDEGSLPLRYVGFSSCFRREAGSYGKDTKGILRVHQFDKVEMFALVRPEDSDAEHERLLAIEEAFMQGLGLPYRVVKLCTGDIGWPSARTYDIEAWIPSEGKYRETHSSSTTTDFQSRRLNIRVRRPTGDVEPLHMLNGTLVAVNRPMIAILELGQQADGSIELPTVLHPHLYGRTRIGAS